MSFRKVELTAVACDLCDKAGLPSKQAEVAEAAAEIIGVTRFMGGRHCCGECREMLKDAVKPAADEKPAKVAKVKAVTQ